MISLIAAMDRNQNIGYKGDMPWGMGMKADLKRFKELTSHSPIIMGRKTLESLPGLLPNRHHIVLSRGSIGFADLDAGKIEVVHSVEEAIEAVKQAEWEYAKALGYTNGFEAFVIGGGQIYQELMPYADKIYLTKVGGYFEGDTKFPSILGKWRITECEKHDADENNPHPYTFMTYERG